MRRREEKADGRKEGCSQNGKKKRKKKAPESQQQCASPLVAKTLRNSFAAVIENKKENTARAQTNATTDSSTDAGWVTSTLRHEQTPVSRLTFYASNLSWRHSCISLVCEVTYSWRDTEIQPELYFF